MRATQVVILISSTNSYNTILGFEIHLNDGLVENILNMGYYLSAYSRISYTVPENDEIQCIRYGLDFSVGIVSLQFITWKKVESKEYTTLKKVAYYQNTCLQSTDDHFVGFSGHLSQPSKLPSFYGLSFNIMSETYKP